MQHFIHQFKNVGLALLLLLVGLGMFSDGAARDLTRAFTEFPENVAQFTLQSGERGLAQVVGEGSEDIEGEDRKDNILVLRTRFAEFPREDRLSDAEVTAYMEQAKDFFEETSYGNYTFDYYIAPPHMSEREFTYDNQREAADDYYCELAKDPNFDIAQFTHQTTIFEVDSALHQDLGMREFEDDEDLNHAHTNKRTFSWHYTSAIKSYPIDCANEGAGFKDVTLARGELMFSKNDPMVGYTDLLPHMQILLHELSHTMGGPLGFGHSFLVSGGTYSNPWDIMGNARKALHQNAIYKKYAGWLTGADTLYIDRPGTYTILAQESVRNDYPRNAEIHLPNSSFFFNKTFEFRQPIGFDEARINNSGSRDNVGLLLAAPYDGQCGFLRCTLLHPMGISSEALREGECFAKDDVRIYIPENGIQNTGTDFATITFTVEEGDGLDDVSCDANVQIENFLLSSADRPVVGDLIEMSYSIVNRGGQAVDFQISEYAGPRNEYSIQGYAYPNSDPIVGETVFPGFSGTLAPGEEKEHVVGVYQALIEGQAGLAINLTVEHEDGRSQSSHIEKFFYIDEREVDAYQPLPNISYALLASQEKVLDGYPTNISLSPIRDEVYIEAGICGGICGDSYVDIARILFGESVTLIAKSDSPKYSFVEWGGELGFCGSNPVCAFTADEQTFPLETSSHYYSRYIHATAYFAEVPTLTFRDDSKTSGGGTLDAYYIKQGDDLQRSLDCSEVAGDCAFSIPEGSEVVIESVTPRADSEFVAYTQGPCTGTGFCRFTLTADTIIGVQLEKKPSITITQEGEGQVRMTVTEPGSGGKVACTDCANDASRRYKKDTSIDLRAVPDAENGSVEWTGVTCTYKADPLHCQFALTEYGQSYEVTATFEEQTENFTYTKNISEYGLISGTYIKPDESIGTLVSCGAGCGSEGINLPEDTTVELVAHTTGTQNKFESWEGCNSVNENSCSAVVGLNDEVRAIFREVDPNHTITIVKYGVGDVTDLEARNNASYFGAEGRDDSSADFTCGYRQNNCTTTQPDGGHVWFAGNAKAPYFIDRISADCTSSNHRCTIPSLKADSTINVWVGKEEEPDEPDDPDTGGGGDKEFTVTLFNFNAGRVTGSTENGTDECYSSRSGNTCLFTMKYRKSFSFDAPPDTITSCSVHEGAPGSSCRIESVVNPDTANRKIILNGDVSWYDLNFYGGGFRSNLQSEEIEALRNSISDQENPTTGANILQSFKSLFTKTFSTNFFSRPVNGLAQVAAGRHPDLVMRDISMLPSQPTLNDEVYLFAQITNEGRKQLVKNYIKADATIEKKQSNGTWSLVYEGIQYPSDVLKKNAMQAVTFPDSWNSYTHGEGIYRLEICVSTADPIVEENITNNCVQDVFRIADTGEDGLFDVVVANENPGIGSGEIVSAVNLGQENFEGCTNNCTKTFFPGTMLVLEAIPSPGFSFLDWVGNDGHGCILYSQERNKCGILVDGNKNIKAKFSEVAQGSSLTITTLAGGSGSEVRSVSTPPQPGKQIKCGDVCSQNFPFDAQVTLRPIAKNDWTFARWEGSDAKACTLPTGPTGECVLTTTATNLNITARFRKIAQTQLGDVNNDFEVTATDALAALKLAVGQDLPDLNTTNADANCDGSIKATDALAILQYAVGKIPELTCDTARSLAPINLTVQGAGALDPQSLTQEGDNTHFTFAATPQPGQIFVEWSGDCESSNLCSFTTDGTQAINVTARFSGESTDTGDNPEPGVEFTHDLSIRSSDDIRLVANKRQATFRAQLHNTGTRDTLGPLRFTIQIDSDVSETHEFRNGKPVLIKEGRSKNIAIKTNWAPTEGQHTYTFCLVATSYDDPANNCVSGNFEIDSRGRLVGATTTGGVATLYGLGVLIALGAGLRMRQRMFTMA